MIRTCAVTRILLALIPLLTLSAPATLPHAAAAQGDILVAEPVAVSGPSPFRPGCEGEASAGQRLPDTEVEPHLAINPRDPNHLVGAWQQDRWTTGGAAGLRTAVTWDGGATWIPTEAPFTNCSGGTAVAGTNYQRASDPWVAFAANGQDVYQAALVVDVAGDGSFVDSAILVSKSTDGGLTWQPSATVRYDVNGEAPGSGFNDKETITADPFDVNFVYAVWDRIDNGAEATGENQEAGGGGGAPIYFARTIDGGQTWEPARPIFRGGETIGNQIAVLPNGDLIDTFLWTVRDPAQHASPTRYVAVIRSTDRGLTWSDPVVVDEVVLTAPIGPAGQQIRPPLGLDVAVDPVSGAIYLAWQEAGFTGGRTVDVGLARSEDGGRTWSEPIVVNRQAPGTGGFVPKVTVRADGVVGVTYYEYATRGSGAAGVPTTYRLASCRAECALAASWEDASIAGPFDLGRAPRIGGATTNGLFVGDYNGLVGVGDRFLTLFALGPVNSETDDQASVYFTSVTVPKS